MYYVCDKKGDKYGIKDTTDGVVEYLSMYAISKIVSKHIKIHGVARVDRQLKVTVLDWWNNVTLICSKAQVLQLALTGYVTFDEKDGDLRTFAINDNFYTNPNEHIVVVLSELGITSMGKTGIDGVLHSSDNKNVCYVIDECIKSFNFKKFLYRKHFFVSSSTTIFLEYSNYADVYNFLDKEAHSIFFTSELVDNSTKFRKHKNENILNKFVDNIVEVSTYGFYGKFKGVDEINDYVSNLDDDYIYNSPLYNYISNYDLTWDANNNLTLFNMRQLLNAIAAFNYNNSPKKEYYVDFLGDFTSYKHYLSQMIYFRFNIRYMESLKVSGLSKLYPLFYLVEEKLADFFRAHEWTKISYNNLNKVDTNLSLNSVFFNKLKNTGCIDIICLKQDSEAKFTKVQTAVNDIYFDAVESATKPVAYTSNDWFMISYAFKKGLRNAYLLGKYKYYNSDIIDKIFTLSIANFKVIYEIFEGFYYKFLSACNISTSDLSLNDFMMDCLTMEHVALKALKLPKCYTDFLDKDLTALKKGSSKLRLYIDYENGVKFIMWYDYDYNGEKVYYTSRI